MKIKFPPRKRLLRLLAILVVAVLLLLYIVMPTALAVVAIWPDNQDPGDPPAGFVDLTLTTRDGLELGAWYAPPTNGAVIILVHGAGSGRQSVRSYATMLHEHGFGVLAVNMRGFGDSEGDINRFGWAGTADVGAAVAYLNSQPDVQAIGGLGLSMGGEILLGAASAYPEITAIVSDGATSRSLGEYKALPKNRSLWRNFTHQVLNLAVRLISGDEPPKPLLDSMREAESTHFLYIAAGDDATEVEFNERFLAVIGAARAVLWVVPEVGHTDGFGTYEADYTTRVVDFFEVYLLGLAPIFG